MVPLALTLAACAKNQGPDCGGIAPVAGTWDYHGVQNTPAPGSTLTGSFNVSTVDGCVFSGSMDLTDTPNGGGAVTVLTGPFFGIAVSPTVINFDAQLGAGTARTHVAEVFGDSMAGQWVIGSGASSPRGTFWARRTGP